ncbi:MAG: sialate O-acetylesterase [Clostridia bacterium]|nr:sialate O-acetylesterase [Clostridia bacterium]
MSRFHLASLFSDGAVLCRRKEIRVFGVGEDGAHLSCRLLDEGGNTLAQDETEIKDGRFCFLLPPQEAQMGCVLTVSDGQEKAICCDIAIGEVYLAGGQSNMELELQNADEGPALIPAHRNPQVRYFNVPKFARFTEEAEEANKNARWVAVAPGTAKDMSAVGYFFAMKLNAHLRVPVGIIDCYWGGTSVTCWMSEETLNLTAEGQRYLKEYEDSWAGKSMEQYLEEEGAFFGGLDAWAKQADALKKEHPEYTTKEINAAIGPCPPWNPPVGEGSPFRPAGLYHTMLERVVPATLTGVLFYQGEEDSWRTKRYDILLSSFIFQLRELFIDGELPFLNVQLPMWIDGAATEDSKLWPVLRMAQEKVRRNVRNTGLAVLIDQGEFDNIHPTNKRVVGERLVECALDVIYHEPARLSPIALGKCQREGKLIVSLSAPVTDCGNGAYLLEIAGEDGVFHPADVRIEGQTLILSSPAVPRPVAARYAWTDYATVRLFGENGLPLAPFAFPVA